MKKPNNYNMNNNEIVLCRTFSSDASAHIAQSLLEEAGIQSIIDNQIFGSVYPIGFNSLGGFRLMVNKKDLPKAMEIVNKSGLE